MTVSQELLYTEECPESGYASGGTVMLMEQVFTQEIVRPGKKLG